MSSDNGGVGHKLHFDYENPIDMCCLSFAERVSPTLYRNGITPNMVTTLSVIASFLAVRNLYRGENRWMFVVWSSLSYLFDCIDGHLARKYDMCTTFGDYYDHISDWLYFIAVFYVAFRLRGLKPAARRYKSWIYGIMIFFGLGAMLHIGLQEIIYCSTRSRECQEGPTLNIFSRISQAVCGIPHESIRMSRWLGVGTFITVSTIIIFFAIR